MPDPELFKSHRAQLVYAALAASAATASAITAYNAYTKSKRRQELAEEVARSISQRPPRPVPDDYGYDPAQADSRKERVVEGPGGGGRTPDEAFSYSEELIREQLARNYAFFGEEAMGKVREGSVVVVGCGGVGSWAAVMLARSGVSKIRLVDFDYVTLSSLNRHATASLKDVGTPKVECVARALDSFARWIHVEPCVDIWRKEDGARLLDGADWVIDAIDNISTKVDLLHYCHEHGIKVFSSMGAGAKSDPTRVQIADISNTHYDPLARSVRRRLKLLGVTQDIPVVYSTEVPGDVKLLPLPEEEFQKGNVKELGVFDDFRVRILPVYGPLPAIFGLHIASYIVCALAGKPILNPLPILNRRKLYEKLFRDLCTRESRIQGQVIQRLPIDEDDVSLVFEDLHVGRSVIPPHLVANRPTLVRWDPEKPVSLENIVVMDFPDAERHTVECFGVTKQTKASGKTVPSSSSSTASGTVPRTSSPEPLLDASVSSIATEVAPPSHLEISPPAHEQRSRESSLSMSSASVEFVTPKEEFVTPSEEIAEEPQDVSDRLEVRYHSRAEEDAGAEAGDGEGAKSTRKRPVEVWGEEVEKLVQARAREIEKYRQWVLSV